MNLWLNLGHVVWGFCMQSHKLWSHNVPWRGRAGGGEKHTYNQRRIFFFRCGRVARDESRIPRADKQRGASGAESQPATETCKWSAAYTHNTGFRSSSLPPRAFSNVFLHMHASLLVQTSNEERQRVNQGQNLKENAFKAAKSTSHMDAEALRTMLQGNTPPPPTFLSWLLHSVAVSTRLPLGHSLQYCTKGTTETSDVGSQLAFPHSLTLDYYGLKVTSRLYTAVAQVAFILSWQQTSDMSYHRVNKHRRTFTQFQHDRGKLRWMNDKCTFQELWCSAIAHYASFLQELCSSLTARER